jgi:excisionase family DNA binding protein
MKQPSAAPLGQEIDHDIVTPMDAARRHTARSVSPGMLTVEEVAEWLKMGRRWVMQQAASGALPARKIGGRWRFSPADVAAFVAAQDKCAARQTKENLT